MSIPMKLRPIPSGDFPLVYIDHGIRTWPIFFDRLHSAFSYSTYLDSAEKGGDYRNASGSNTPL